MEDIEVVAVVVEVVVVDIIKIWKINKSSNIREKKMSSLCLLDDPRFFVGRPDTMRVSGRSMFQDVFRLGAHEDGSNAKRVTFVCRNCKCNVFELVFNVGCSVECALGYFALNVHARNLIVNRFYTVVNYRDLEITPEPLPMLCKEATREELLTRYVGELYHPGDPRRSVYIKQILSNVVETTSATRR